MAHATCKLGLGTVQFGLRYGVSNLTGKVPESVIRGLLEYAWQSGVRTLDTASAYGDSEAVLGRNLQDPQGFAIVTKTVPLSAREITRSELEAVERGLRTSLQRLRVPSVYGLLVHHADNLLCSGGRALYDLLTSWKSSGLVSKVGASVYDSCQLRRLMDVYPLELVQLPVNVFDQRLITDGTLDALKSRGVEVHARSVFLQGLLLMSEGELPPHMRRFAPEIMAYRRYLQQRELPALEVALGFVKHLAQLDIALIGVNSLDHLQECVAAYQRAQPLDLAHLASDDVGLVDPRRWRAQ